MAVANANMKRHEEALKLYEKCRNIQESALGSNHPSLLNTYKSIVSMLEYLGRDEEATKLRQNVKMQKSEEEVTPESNMLCNSIIFDKCM